MSNFKIYSTTAHSRDGRPLLANRYRIVRQLGKDGLGRQWLAEDLDFGNKRVAVRILPRAVVAKAQVYVKLKAVATAAMKLDHPNIAKLYALEDNAGSPFVVRDYVDGQTLECYVADFSGGARPAGGKGADAKADGGRVETEIVRILRQVAEALDYAHAHGVVHRDLNPANVIVRKDGTPVILDFGIAREIREALARVKGKSLNANFRYMSPEQQHGGAPAPAQDIYSFAGTAYACLKGVLSLVRCAESWGGANASLARLATAVLQGLAKKPESRPATCLAVLGVTGLAQGGANAVQSESDGEKARWRMLAEQEAEERRRLGPPSGTAKTIILPGGAEMRLRWCRAGVFMMGSETVEDGRCNDENLHRVTLTHGFWIGETAVTQAAWRSVMGDNPSEFKGDNLPVDSVSWRDCMKFIEKVNEKLDCKARLPTESEWEYACRAGTLSPFAGTGKVEEMAWCDNEGGCETHPVGCKKPNAWGLYDMHGNIWEWCSDRYGKYPLDAVTDPQGAEKGSMRVLRGGSWSFCSRFCRAAVRFKNYPIHRGIYCGFRLCCSEEPGK